MATCATCGGDLEHIEAECPACALPVEPPRTLVDATGASPLVPFADSRLPAEPAAVRPSVRIQTLLLLLVVAFGVVDFLTIPIVRAVEPSGMRDFHLMAILVSLWVAVLFAQFVLLAVWWVFSPLDWLPRAVLGLAAPAIWCALFFVGALLAVPDEFGGGQQRFWLAIVQMTAPLPLLMMATQLFLWCMRIWFGWRIEQVAITASPVERKSLRILDVMLATGAVAMALTLAKFGNRNEFMAISDGQYLVQRLIISGFAAVLTALSVLPCVWAGLRRTAPRWGFFVAAAVQAAIVINFLAIVTLLSGRNPTPSGLWGYCFLTVGVYFAITMLILYGCRRCGYGLRWKKE